MGITRDSQHKRRLTGGKKPHHHKKRKHEMGRQMAMTKIGAKRIHPVRVRGGNMKFRGIRLDTGNMSWGSEVCTRKTRILDVVYNASNNELVRTKTLVKSAIVQIDATYARPRPCCCGYRGAGEWAQGSGRGGRVVRWALLPGAQICHVSKGLRAAGRAGAAGFCVRAPLRCRPCFSLRLLYAVVLTLFLRRPPTAGRSVSGTRRIMGPLWERRGRRRPVRRLRRSSRPSAQTRYAPHEKHRPSQHD